MKDSFSSIGRLKSDTPVENFTLSDKAKLTDEDDEDQGLCSPSRRTTTAVWALLICLIVIVIVGVIVGIVYGIISASGNNDETFNLQMFENLHLESSSSGLVSSLRKGPGDNGKINYLQILFLF